MLLSSCAAVMVSFSSDDQTERLKVTFSRRKETSHRLDGVSLPNTESRERLSCDALGQERTGVVCKISTARTHT